MTNKKLYPRRCDECGQGMSDGYCIDNGDWHYCSDVCLFVKHTAIEWANMYGNGEGDSYWTEWEDIEVEENGIGYTITGKEVCLDE